LVSEKSETEKYAQKDQCHALPGRRRTHKIKHYTGSVPDPFSDGLNHFKQFQILLEIKPPQQDRLIQSIAPTFVAAFEA
jgi:hypothetical protein